MDLTNIIDAVHHVTGVDPDQMKENTRKGEIVSARQWVMYFATGNLREIGGLFNRNHATVIHARKTKQNHMEYDRAVKAEHDAIKERIKGEVFDFVI